MDSLLSATANTRFLPDGRMRYIRSDAVICVTADDVAVLKNLGVTLVLDLRSDAEARALPCSLGAYPCFDYFRMPLSGTGGRTPEGYLSMLEEGMAELLRTLEMANGTVLFFCHEGRDRTGVVSALLLLRQGVEEQVILKDYMASFARENPENQEEAKSVMTQFLKEIRSHPLCFG